VAARLHCRPQCRRPGTEPISGSSVSGPNVATIECNGRTQRNDGVSKRIDPKRREANAPLADCLPHRMDFGHENSRMTAGMTRRSLRSRGRPGFSITAT